MNSFDLALIYLCAMATIATVTIIYIYHKSTKGEYDD